MATTGGAPGRRERKKAATRKALADAALELFLEKGYENVTIAQIAEAADTATTTLFAHFPAGKEALILDDSGERETSLKDAVRDRPEGGSALEALHAFFAARAPFADDRELPERYRRASRLVLDTPSLRGYARQVWVACQEPLAHLLAEAAGRSEPDESLHLLAGYVLETPGLAAARPDRKAALDESFRRLRLAWPEL